MELGGVGRVPVEAAWPLSWRPKAMAMLDIGFWAEAAMFTVGRQGLTGESKRELVGSRAGWKGGLESGRVSNQNV